MSLKQIRFFILALLLSNAAFADVIKTIQVGATDQTVTVTVIDSATGVPSTDLAYNSSGIDLKYWRHGANAAVDITEATQTVNGAHSDGGFVHVGHGIYRLDLPDAAVASGATAVDVYGTITGEIVIGGTVQLVAYNPQDAVRLGLTALPNANADAAGGLPISDAGGLDLDGVLSGNTPQTGDSFARLGAPAGASHAADIAAVKSDTAATLVDTADMQPKLGTFTDFGSGTSTLAANLQDLADDGTATYSRATDSLQAIRDQGDSAWITGGGGACTADVGCIADGTAQGVTATTIQLASAETFADTELQCATVVIASASTGAGQARQIDSYVGSTDTATVPTWTTTPTGTITYRVFATPCGSTSNPAPANMVQVSGDSAAADNLEAASDGTGYNLGNGSIVAASVTGAVGSVTGNVGGNVVGSVASVTGAVGSVTGNVGGNVTGSVGSVTGAVGSVTGNVGGTVNGLTSTAQGNVRTAVGLASANLDTQLDALPTAAENATEHLSQQRVLTGTCDSGSTTTCVDDALTQANESQLDDRLICFSDSWCALITGFTPGTDTVTTTKAAPSTRASLGYTIFPATAQ